MVVVVVAVGGATVTDWLVVADAPPLRTTVWPVKTWAVEVPDESVTVRVAAKCPAPA